MSERLIMERPFIFEADNEKGYAKLRDNQFPRIEHGIVYEPLANALDQHHGEGFVEITLEEKEDCCLLSFRDNGDGLSHDNLEGLHIIGKSTKRERKGECIGRFGMGLVGAFHQKLGVHTVEIISMVGNVPVRIIYDCNGSGIPLWRMEVHPEDVKGFIITFHLPLKNSYLIRDALEDVLCRTIVPLIFNGVLYHHPPLELLKSAKNDILISDNGEPELHYAAHCSESPNRFGNRDTCMIYLRGLPVEEGEMYRIFITDGGDKMAQNYSSVPYMKDETCVVLSRAAEPTVGRDKLLRNDEFRKLGNAIFKVRAEALQILLYKARQSGCDKRIKEYADAMAIANLHCLRSQIMQRIKLETFHADYAYLSELIDDLLDYPVIPIFRDKSKLSLRTVLACESPVLLFAETRESGSYFENRHTLPFIMVDELYSFHPLWGGHEKHLMADVIKALLECRTNCEVVSLEELMFRDEKLQEMVNRGIIERDSITWEPVNPLPESASKFMLNLSETMNSHWFRKSLSKFNSPSRINLLAIQTTNNSSFGEVIAALMGGNRQSGEVTIAVNIASETVSGIMQHPSGYLAFLPILCHELAHRRRDLLNGEQNIPHGQGFYLDRIRLETSVLTSCVRYLAGEQAEGGDEFDSNLGEVVVL